MEIPMLRWVDKSDNIGPMLMLTRSDDTVLATVYLDGGGQMWAEVTSDRVVGPKEVRTVQEGKRWSLERLVEMELERGDD